MRLRQFIFIYIFLLFSAHAFSGITVTDDNRINIVVNDSISMSKLVTSSLATGTFLAGPDIENSYGRGDSMYDPTSKAYNGRDSIFDVTFYTDTSSILNIQGWLNAEDKGSFGSDLASVSVQEISGSSVTNLYYLGVQPYSDGDLSGYSSLSFSESIFLSSDTHYRLVARTSTTTSEWGFASAYSSYGLTASFDGNLISEVPAPVPVPPAAFLFGSAILCFTGLRRFKR